MLTSGLHTHVHMNVHKYVYLHSSEQEHTHKYHIYIHMQKIKNEIGLSFIPHTKVYDNGALEIVRLLERKQAVLLDNSLSKDSIT